jgi:hypothetical protein
MREVEARGNPRLATRSKSWEDKALREQVGADKPTFVSIHTTEQCEA